MENEEEITVIRPGEPGYEEAQQDLVDSCPDNRPISLVEMLQYVDGNISSFEEENVNFDFLSDEKNTTLEPSNEFLARQKRLKLELEQEIAKAEAQEPGSSKPPVPTEEEKEFYSVKEDK